MEKFKNEQYKAPNLDMKKTFEWYTYTNIELPPMQKIDFSYSIENPELIELSERELSSLLSLFPENARKRSILRKIIGQPAAWFHKDSTNEKLKPTNNKLEALSPTAIIPSYIDYTPWSETKIPTADIWLYQISQDIASDKARRLALIEGFIHEIGHSIVQPAFYIKNYNLKFPNGKIMSGTEIMLFFAKLAEQHSPISNYASIYRGTNNKFENKKVDYNIKIAISEEMCETITAYLLGFIYCENNFRAKNPFADRPEIKNFIKDFLNAELINLKND